MVTVKSRPVRSRWIRRVMLLLLTLLGVAALWLYLYDYFPPRFYYVNAFNVRSVRISLGQTRVTVTDPQIVPEFTTAFLHGDSPCNYATQCLPDEHPEDWSVTFVRKDGSTFPVWFGVIDTCGTYYCPSLDRTYKDKGLLGVTLRNAGMRQIFDEHGMLQIVK